jgi:hypothetical protein
MFLNTQRWEQLTRTGVPELVVWRQPLMIKGHLLKAGDIFPIEGNERCIRNLWDQNKITTVDSFGGVAVLPKPAKKKRGK